MAWQTECVRIVRYLINDLDETNYSFSDTRLQETLLVAAQYVFKEVTLAQAYTIDVDALTLTPDPTEGTKDDSFINLVCLKAACIIDRARFRSTVGQSIRVKDGSSEIDLTSAYKGHEILLKEGNCKEYEKAKLDYLMGGNGSVNGGVGKFIFGPYRIQGSVPSSEDRPSNSF